MSTTDNSSSTPSNAPYSAPTPAPSGSNKPLTYLLYALLIGLVGLLGFRAIKLKNEKTAAAKAEAEYQQLLTETGYTADDTTSGVASPTTATVAADSKPLNLTEPNAANGIAANAGKAVSESAKKAEKAVESATKTTAKAVKSDTDDDELTATTASKTRAGVDKKRPVTYAAPKGVSTKPPFVVVAASFSSKAGATKVMESLVKKGFENAEVTNKFRNGKYWYVIAERAKTEADAKKAQAEVAKIKDCEKAYVSKIK